MELVDFAKDYFKDLGITGSSGHCFLGGVIGTQEHHCRKLHETDTGWNVLPKYLRQQSGHLKRGI